MARRREPELGPGDRKALREREESHVTPGEDARMVRLLADREGMPTRVHLVDGRELEVFEIAWGHDLGDPYAHVTTNISSADRSASDFFFTYSVVRITDSETGALLFQVKGP